MISFDENPRRRMVWILLAVLAIGMLAILFLWASTRHKSSSFVEYHADSKVDLAELGQIEVLLRGSDRKSNNGTVRGAPFLLIVSLLPDHDVPEDIELTFDVEIAEINYRRTIDAQLVPRGSAPVFSSFFPDVPLEEVRGEKTLTIRTEAIWSGRIHSYSAFQADLNIDRSVKSITFWDVLKGI